MSEDPVSYRVDLAAPSGGASTAPFTESDVLAAWKCVRQNNSTISDEALDAMRDVLLACARPQGPEVSEAFVVDVATRDCGYGFSGHAVMSDGSRAFHTTALHPTEDAARREVTGLIKAAGDQQ